MMKLTEKSKILQQLQKNQEKFGKLGKLGDFIRKNSRILGKFTPILGKFGVRPKKKEEKKRSSLNFGWEIRKIAARLGKFIWKIRKIRKGHQEDQEDQESSFGKFGRFIRKIRKIRKVHQENSYSILGKFLLHIRKILPQKTGSRRQKHFFQLWSHSDLIK